MQTDQTKLDSGDTFPPLSLSLLDGETLDLPTARWTVLLLYRGQW